MMIAFVEPLLLICIRIWYDFLKNSIHYQEISCPPLWQTFFKIHQLFKSGSITKLCNFITLKNELDLTSLFALFLIHLETLICVLITSIALFLVQLWIASLRRSISRAFVQIVPSLASSVSLAKCRVFSTRLDWVVQR